MEFWKYLTEGKDLFLPEELEIPVDDMVKNRNKLSGQEPETLYDTSNCPFLLSRGTLEGQDLIELGFPDPMGSIRQADCSDPCRDALSDRIGIDYYTEVASQTCTSPDVVSQEKQLGSRISGLFEESGGLDSATINLKLGGLAYSMGAGDGECSKVHSSMPSMPKKRTRLTSLCSQTPICQVYGCNKDLSSSKDYYKRHKVCDAHTKTAKVIVKGIEQRFCQQCSRFHLLTEFDDGKRSCRKRLANHNQRRRKPPGTRFVSSSSFRRTSFLFQQMLPTAFSGPSKHESGEWFGHMKFEDPGLDLNSILNFRDNISVGTIDRTSGTAVASDQNFSHIPDSSCALSLLSAQSQKASDQLLGTAISSPMVATLSHHNYSSAQGLTYSANSEKIGSSRFHSPGKAGTTLTVSSNGVGAGLKVPDDGVITGSNTLNSKYCLSSGQGTMVDLLQLSSHLQMVEHKRKLMH